MGVSMWSHHESITIYLGFLTVDAVSGESNSTFVNDCERLWKLLKVFRTYCNILDKQGNTSKHCPFLIAGNLFHIRETKCAMPPPNECPLTLGTINLTGKLRKDKADNGSKIRKSFDATRSPWGLSNRSRLIGIDCALIETNSFLPTDSKEGRIYFLNAVWNKNHNLYRPSWILFGWSPPKLGISWRYTSPSHIYFTASGPVWRGQA